MDFTTGTGSNLLTSLPSYLLNGDAVQLLSLIGRNTTAGSTRNKGQGETQGWLTSERLPVQYGEENNKTDHQIVCVVAVQSSITVPRT